MLGLFARNFLHGYRSCAQLEEIKQILETERWCSLASLDGRARDHLGRRRGGEQAAWSAFRPVTCNKGIPFYLTN